MWVAPSGGSQDLKKGHSRRKITRFSLAAKCIYPAAAAAAGNSFVGIRTSTSRRLSVTVQQYLSNNPLGLQHHTGATEAPSLTD